jgi:hypothetical protein
MNLNDSAWYPLSSAFTMLSAGRLRAYERSNDLVERVFDYADGACLQQLRE